MADRNDDSFVSSDSTSIKTSASRGGSLRAKGKNTFASLKSKLAAKADEMRASSGSTTKYAEREDPADALVAEPEPRHREEARPTVAPSRTSSSFIRDSVKAKIGRKNTEKDIKDLPPAPVVIEKDAAPAPPALAAAAVAPYKISEPYPAKVAIAPTDSLALGPLKDPLSQHIGPVITGVVAVAVVAQALSMFLHWSAGLVAIAVGASVLKSRLELASKDAVWERQEMERIKQPQHPESAEWMNTILRTVWPLISTDYFVPFVDLLEDALMQQVPGIVHGCRVDGLDQGTVPLRIVDFTRLPNDEHSFLHGADAVHNVEDKDDEIDFDVGDFVNLEVSFAYRAPAARRKKASSNKAEGLDDDGQADSADEGSGSAVEQIHLLMLMQIGLQKIAAVEVPVWIEMLGIEGKMRLRVQLTPAAPFVKHVAFCFVGKPRIEIAARPLGKRMVIDAMQLPLISSYVLRSIEAVIKDFIAPKSYTVDVGGLLGAGDGPQNVYGLGVLCIVVHRATGLAASDVGGTSDPYVSASFARSGKPLYTSRVITKTCNPVWGETAFLIVTPDEVRDHERLRLTVYDADRFSADDPLGKVDISVAKLVRREIQSDNEPGMASMLEDREDNLQPMRRGAAVQGKLRYSVGFFRLAQPVDGQRHAARQAMLRQMAYTSPSTPHSTEPSVKSMERTSTLEIAGGRTHDIPSAVQAEVDPASFMTGFDRFVTKLGLPLDEEVMRARAQRSARVAALVAMATGEATATAAPPDERWGAGILAFHVHSIDGLEVPNTQKSLVTAKRLEKKPRYTQATDENPDAKAKLPSSYVQVLINDEAVFRTRTKALNSRPFINAGMERWVTDWRKARIDFIVRDARMRESDPILGSVGMRIADVLKDSGKVTAQYTLTGGLGFGKIRISIVWRSIELMVPKPLSGWNLGVVEISAARVSNLVSDELDGGKGVQIFFETVGGTCETPYVEPQTHDGSMTIEYALKEPMRVPVRQRYPSFLYIHLRTDSRVPGRKNKHAHAVVPLNRIPDDTGVVRKLALYGSPDWQALEQDALVDFSKRDADDHTFHSGDLRPVLEELCAVNAEPAGDKKILGDLEQIGTIELALTYYAGIAEEHRSLTTADAEMRIAYEAFLANMDAGERPKPSGAGHAHSVAVPKLGSSSDDLSARKPRDRSSAPPPARPSLPHLDTAGSNGEEGSEAKNKHRRNVSMPNELGIEEDVDEEDSDAEWEAGQGDAEEPEPDTPEGRRARNRNLHRQQRGAAQIKGVRSLMWIKQNAEDSIGRMKKAGGQQSKKLPSMQTEGVSHF